MPKEKKQVTKKWEPSDDEIETASNVLAWLEDWYTENEIRAKLIFILLI
jgi:hypothetical protein